jgi:hypothetical protein
VSCLRFDIFCVLIISPAIVPESISASEDDSDYGDSDHNDTDDILEPRDHPLAPPEKHDDGDDDKLPRASIHSKNIAVDIEILPKAPKPS